MLPWGGLAKVLGGGNIWFCINFAAYSVQPTDQSSMLSYGHCIAIIISIVIIIIIINSIIIEPLCVSCCSIELKSQPELEENILSAKVAAVHFQTFSISSPHHCQGGGGGAEIVANHKSFGLSVSTANIGLDAALCWLDLQIFSSKIGHFPQLVSTIFQSKTHSNKYSQRGNIIIGWTSGFALAIGENIYDQTPLQWMVPQGGKIIDIDLKLTITFDHRVTPHFNFGKIWSN